MGWALATGLSSLQAWWVPVDPGGEEGEEGEVERAVWGRDWAPAAALSLSHWPTGAGTAVEGAPLSHGQRGCPSEVNEAVVQPGAGEPAGAAAGSPPTLAPMRETAAETRGHPGHSALGHQGRPGVGVSFLASLDWEEGNPDASPPLRKSS